MIAPDSTLATALQAESTLAVATPAGADRWADRGRAIAGVSPFATAAGGAAEAARTAALFAGPVVRDRVAVTGDVRHLHKRCIRLKAAGLDYAPDGELVIVLAIAEQASGTTILTVLKRQA